METEIKASLIELMDGIKKADGRVIAAVTARMDEVVAGKHASLDPQLVHFLRRRSYMKALQHLQGDENIPAGICGGGKVKTQS